MSATTLPRQAGRERSDRSYRHGRWMVDVILYLLVFAALVILLLPIAWMLSTSLKPLADVFSYPPRWIPAHPTLASYRAELNPTLGTYFLNSLIVGLCSAVVATLTGALAAYGLARLRFRANTAILMFFMASLAFPIPLLMISMYILFVKLHLLNTYASLIIGHTVVTLPVAVWLLKSFFDQLPSEIEEAAFVDGASPAYTFFRIVMPMAKPALDRLGHLRLRDVLERASLRADLHLLERHAAAAGRHQHVVPDRVRGRLVGHDGPRDHRLDPDLSSLSLLPAGVHAGSHGGRRQRVSRCRAGPGHDNEEAEQ